MTSHGPLELAIRPARRADAEMISRMIHELAIYERAPEQCFATPEGVEKQLFGRSPKAEAIIAELNGQVAGFALFFHNFSTWECAPGIYLEDLFVRPAWRGRGLGKALLQRVAAIAVERGCKRLDFAVLDWNQPSRDFYHSLGARPLEEWVLYRAEGEALKEMGKAPAGEDSPAEEPLPDAGHPVVIHTDGGAQPNPGVGAWAAVLRWGPKTRELSGGELGTTNNRMELMAAIRSLESLKRACRVEIHTDSQYLKNGITTWIHNWKKRGWMRAGNAAVKNADLWKRLDAVCQRHSVEWRWVRGHAGAEDNERCDALCHAEIERLVAGSTEAERRRALAAEMERQNSE